MLNGWWRRRGMSQSKQFILAELFKREKTKSLCVCVVLCYKRWCWWLLRVVQVKRDPSIHWCITPPQLYRLPQSLLGCCCWWAGWQSRDIWSKRTWTGGLCVYTMQLKTLSTEKIKLFQLFYSAGFDYDYLDELILSWMLLWLPKEFKKSFF